MFVIGYGVLKSGFDLWKIFVLFVLEDLWWEGVGRDVWSVRKLEESCFVLVDGWCGLVLWSCGVKEDYWWFYIYGYFWWIVFCVGLYSLLKFIMLDVSVLLEVLCVRNNRVFLFVVEL